MERTHAGEGIEGRCRVTKVMICGIGLGLMQSSGLDVHSQAQNKAQ